MMRTYGELIKIENFLDRYEYLKLNGSVGAETFGFDRWLNQIFYRSPEWKHIREEVIIRDDGCDLGIRDRPIGGRIYVHHMNPIDVKSIVERKSILLNPDFLICCSHNTHEAIHYGNSDILLPDKFVERKPNDTIPWR
jgi:hypothetical protein